MIRRSIALLVPTVVVALASSSFATTTLVAELLTDNEPSLIGPTTSGGAARAKATGLATFVINDALTQMTMTVTVNDIDINGLQTPADTNDDLRAAHIHAGFSSNPKPATYPVVWGFFGTPLNDNNPNDVVVTPFSTGVGGTITGKWDAPEGNNTTFAAQLNNLVDGRAYINFHTAQNPGGEIRGTLVPEPSSVALLGVVAGGALVRRRRAGAV